MYLFNARSAAIQYMHQSYSTHATQHRNGDIARALSPSSMHRVSVELSLYTDLTLSLFLSLSLISLPFRERER